MCLMSDASRVVDFGLTPILVFATLFVILLYEKYFGENDFVAVLAILVLATLIYCFLLSFSIFNVVFVVVCLLLCWLLILPVGLLFKKSKKALV